MNSELAWYQVSVLCFYKHFFKLIFIIAISEHAFSKAVPLLQGMHWFTLAEAPEMEIQASVRRGKMKHNKRE